MESMKYEFHSVITSMKEKLDLMIKKLDGQEEERKKKELVINPTKSTVDSKIPLKSKVEGESTAVRIHHEGSEKVENRSRPMKTQVFVGGNLADWS